MIDLVSRLWIPLKIRSYCRPASTTFRPSAMTLASRYAWRTALDSRWRNSDPRVDRYVVVASTPERTSAPNANVAVMRARRPRRCGRKRAKPRRRAPGTSALEAVTEPPYRHDMTRVSRVDLDLGAQPAHVHIDESSVTEVAVAPHAVEQHLAREDATRVRAEFAQQTELGLGEMDLARGECDLALVGDDLEIAEDELRMRSSSSTARMRVPIPTHVAPSRGCAART